MINAIRIAAFVAGAAALCVSVMLAVEGNYDYDSTMGRAYMGAAIVTALLALVAGFLANAGSWRMAAFLIVMLLGVEAFWISNTVHRLLAEDSKVQAPIEAQKRERAHAAQRVIEARMVIDDLRKGTPRVEAASKEVKRVQDGGIEKADKRHCSGGCVKMFGRFEANARAELAAARLDQKRQIDEATAELEAARTALGALPAANPKSVASYLGMSSEAYAIMRAVMLAMLNVAGMVGLYVSGHGIKQAAPSETAREQIARFAVECYEPADSGRVLIAAAYRDYKDWCRVQGSPRVNLRRFADELQLLTARSSLAIEYEGKQAVITGLA